MKSLACVVSCFGWQRRPLEWNQDAAAASAGTRVAQVGASHCEGVRVVGVSV